MNSKATLCYTPPEVHSGKLELTIGSNSNNVLRRRNVKQQDLRKAVLTQNRAFMNDILLDRRCVSSVKIWFIHTFVFTLNKKKIPIALLL